MSEAQKKKTPAKLYRLKCTPAQLQEFGRFNVALQGRYEDGEVMEGADGRIFRSLTISAGRFNVNKDFQKQSFEAMRGLPKEVEDAVQSGHVLIEEISAADAKKLNETLIFDPAATLAKTLEERAD